MNESDPIHKQTEAEISPEEAEKLETTKKVGRSLADKLNNDLAIPMGTLDMVLADPQLSPNHKSLLEEVMQGLEHAGKRSDQLINMKRFKETNTPGGQPMLDWDKSLNPHPLKPSTPPKP